MLEVAQILELGQAGIVVLLVAAVVALWRRLNAVTDSFTRYLQDSASNGDLAAQRVLLAPAKGKRDA